MLVSVVIPSFNQAPYLADAIESSLSQRAPGVDVEVVVVDGGSTDGSAEIIRRYAPRLAWWAAEPDRGQTHALMKGFAKCSGDIMGWLNSDDYYEPGALAKVCGVFASNPASDVVYGDMNWVKPDRTFVRRQREIPLDGSILLWDYCYLPQPSTLWRRSIWERVDGLDEAIVCAMDLDLWLKFIKAGAAFRHVNAVLSNMRTYPEQKNRRLRSLSDQEVARLREKFLAREPGQFECRLRYLWNKSERVVRKVLSGAYF